MKKKCPRLRIKFFFNFVQNLISLIPFMGKWSTDYVKKAVDKTIWSLWNLSMAKITHGSHQKHRLGTWSQGSLPRTCGEDHDQGSYLKYYYIKWSQMSTIYYKRHWREAFQNTRVSKFTVMNTQNSLFFIIIYLQYLSYYYCAIVPFFWVNKATVMITCMSFSILTINLLLPTLILTVISESWDIIDYTFFIFPYFLGA